MYVSLRIASYGRASGINLFDYLNASTHHQTFFLLLLFWLIVFHEQPCLNNLPYPTTPNIYYWNKILISRTKRNRHFGRSFFRSYSVNQLYKLHRQDHQITDQNFYLVVQVVAQLKSKASLRSKQEKLHYSHLAFYPIIHLLIHLPWFQCCAIY